MFTNTSFLLKSYHNKSIILDIYKTCAGTQKIDGQYYKKKKSINHTDCVHYRTILFFSKRMDLYKDIGEQQNFKK